MAVSTVLFVHFFQLYSHESTRTYLNGNPFQLRNEIIQSWENYAGFLWLVTLTIGFLVLAPGQVMSGDVIARRWTDVIWTSSRRVQQLKGNQVKYIYYGILAAYGLWGLFVLTIFPNPLMVLKIAGFLMNVALGFTAFHVLYVNRTLLPREFGPGWFMQAGLVLSGTFFLGISVVVLIGL